VKFKKKRLTFKNLSKLDLFLFVIGLAAFFWSIFGQFIWVQDIGNFLSPDGYCERCSTYVVFIRVALFFAATTLIIFRSNVTKILSYFTFNNAISFLNFLIMAILLFYCARFFVIGITVLVGYPYPLDFGEGPVLHTAMQFREYGTCYRDIHEEPYTHCLYPPVFPFLQSLLIQIFGEKLITGRLISLLSLIAIMYLGYKVFKIESKDRFLILLFVVMLPLRATMRWAHIGRIDLLAIAFSVAGIYFYYKNKNEFKNIYISMIFFTLAFLTKQTSIIAPAAVFLDLILQRRFKFFLKSLLVYALHILVSLSVLAVLTNGLFFLHVFSYNSAISYYLPDALRFMVFFIELVPILLLFCLAHAILSRKISLWLIYLFLAFGGILTAGRIIASYNHTLEAQVALVFCCFFSMEWLIKRYRKHKPAILFIWVGFLIAVLMLVPTFDWSYNEKNSDALVQKIASVPGEVIVEDPTYSILANKKVIIQDSFFFGQAGELGLWNSSKLVSDCENQRFEMIIFSTGNYYGIPGFIECVNTYYKRLPERTGVTYVEDIYVPRNLSKDAVDN
jgi:hypothetical protein